MKIEFDGRKLLVWFLVDGLYWLPLILCVDTAVQTWGYPSRSWEWWLFLFLGWEWISWGNRLYLKYKEAYPDD